MTRATSPRPATARPGFSLVELLVAISIIAVLLSITAVAVQKTTENQRYKTSREQVYKLQQSLDAEYDRVVKQCADDARTKNIPQKVVDYCDNDTNRAQAVWTAMKLRQQFPDSFSEATTPFTAIPGYSLSALTTFTSNPQVTAAVGGTSAATRPAEQAALLYLIMSAKSVSGGGAMAASADDLGQQTTVTIGGQQFKAFMDAWNNPVCYRRWFGLDTTNPAENDVQAAQYAGSVNQFNPANKDPLDPRNLVLGWSNGTKAGQMNSGLSFTGRNRTATVYAVCKDGTPLTGDDILGYTLRRYK